MSPKPFFPALAAEGLALFLFIPLVLYLFLRQPLGPGWSVGIGLAVMVGHRFIAQPWAAKYADARCLWCGRVGGEHAVDVVSGGRAWPMRACSAAHARRARRFMAFVSRFRLPIALGIFLPLGWLVAASLAAAFGHPLLPHPLNALIFRVVVAATVLVASLSPLLPGAGADAGEPARCPFPVHNLVLLGMGYTLWVFRVVGAWWIVGALVRLAR